MNAQELSPGPQAHAPERSPFHPDIFTPLLGHHFTVEAPGGADLQFTLMEMTEPKRFTMALPGNPHFIGFTLNFRGPAEPLLPQRIYAMRNAIAGGMEIFIVPYGRDADNALWYQAVFNIRDSEVPALQTKEQPHAE